MVAKDNDGFPIHLRSKQKRREREREKGKRRQEKEEKRGEGKGRDEKGREENRRVYFRKVLLNIKTNSKHHKTLAFP